MWRAFFVWVATNPDEAASLAAALLAVLTALAVALERRAPKAAAVIRSLIIFLPGLVRAIRRPDASTGPAHKVVQPMIVADATRVVDADAAAKPPPGPTKEAPKVPPVIFLLALVGCSASLEPAKASANATREVGIAGADLLERLCTEPYRRAQTREEVDAIRARGCREAANAYDALRAAHTTLVAVIQATEAGQCVGVSRSAEHCNVAGAYVALAKAASQWATAVERLQGGAS